MKWPSKVGTISGIEVRIHATFLLLLGWADLTHRLAGHSLDAALSGLTFLMALFG